MSEVLSKSVKETVKVRKIGNSLGIVLPRDTLKHLRVSEGDELAMERGDDGSLRLVPHDEQVERQMAVARKVMRRYENTLRELAK